MNRRYVLAGLLIAAGIWLLWPALTAVHVEGVSAQLQSQALILARTGSISAHDPYLALVTEYIFLKCLGVVDLLALLQSALGMTGDSAFRLLTIASLAVLLIASVSFARRRGNVTIAAALAALILTPGIPDSAFFFNDNVVSAAFAALSLALARPDASGGRYLLSGLCAGMAGLCRLDGILAFPLLLGVVFVDRVTVSVTVRRLVALAAGLSIVLGVSAVVNGATLIDSLWIYRFFSYARQIGFDLRWNLFALAYFFGMITPFLLLIGIARDNRTGISTRRWLDAAFFCAYPLLLCVFAVCTGREVRYLFPLLAPIIALHGGRGIEWLVEQARMPAAERKTALLIAAAAVMVVALIAPPSVVSISDGPRMLVGRLWSPVSWWRWQRVVDESMSRVSALTRELDREPTPLVITTSWNGEFFVHLRLLELGYDNSTAAAVFPGCDGFSVYTRGEHRILHLRLHNEFYLVPYDHTAYGALTAARAAECPAANKVSNTWVNTFGSKGDKWIDPDLMGFGYERFPHRLEITFIRDWLRERVVHKVQPGPPWCCSDSLFDYVKISDGERANIFTNAKRIAIASATGADSTPAAMFHAAREANLERTGPTQRQELLK
ncbi:MAG: hypothetical protein JSR66_31440 [Proteobacteria bacterium]|nr:hypothetical protein [Pseudomonadota bacterium]